MQQQQQQPRVQQVGAEWPGILDMFNKLHYIESYNTYTWNLLAALHNAKAKTRADIATVLAAQNINIFVLKFMLISVLNIDLIEVDTDLHLQVRQDILDNYSSILYPINVFAIFEHSLQRLLYNATAKQLAIVKAPVTKTNTLLEFLYDFLYAYLGVVYKVVK